jgi:hypothetical protein
VGPVAAAALNVHGEHHVGAQGAEQPDVVADDFLPAPLADHFLRVERVAVVDGAREVLLGAVEAVRRQQLGRAQHAHVPEQLGADFVLPAVAAIVLQVDRTQAHAQPEHGEQRVGLIVGVRRALHEGPGDAQLAKRQAQPDVAAVGRHPRKAHAVLRRATP